MLKIITLLIIFMSANNTYSLGLSEFSAGSTHDFIVKDYTENTHSMWGCVNLINCNFSMGMFIKTNKETNKTDLNIWPHKRKEKSVINP